MQACRCLPYVVSIYNTYPAPTIAIIRRDLYVPICLSRALSPIYILDSNTFTALDINCISFFDTSFTMALKSDLTIDASKFDRSTIDKQTLEFNEKLIGIWAKGPRWYEVYPPSSSPISYSTIFLS
jgi:hypothetical protein